MDLDGIRAKFCQRSGDFVSIETMLMLLDQAPRASGEATPTPITSIRKNPYMRSDRPRRADSLTGSRAVRRTELGVEPGFSKMGIGSIAEADHQPGHRQTLRREPAKALPSGSHNSRVCGDVNAMDTSCAKNRTQVGDRWEILIAGSTDQLDPASLGQGALRVWDQPFSN